MRFCWNLFPCPPQFPHKTGWMVRTWYIILICFVHFLHLCCSCPCSLALFVTLSAWKWQSLMTEWSGWLLVICPLCTISFISAIIKAPIPPIKKKNSTANHPEAASGLWAPPVDLWAIYIKALTFSDHLKKPISLYLYKSHPCTLYPSLVNLTHINYL